jgi:3-phosphoshikimate 1-carboxyvinyltransferase
MRVLMGLLCGYPGLKGTMTGDVSLNKRPMKRVAGPLALMGAKFTLTNENYAPLSFEGQQLQAINFELKIASAQIKTAIIMAALHAKGTTHITGEIGSRDHTERLLPHFGCPMKVTDKEIILEGGKTLIANKVHVPSDPSTAAFWIGAASIISGSNLEMENISLNPTRIGFIEVLKRMGASITMEMKTETPEPIGVVRVVSANLRGVQVTKEEIPSLIDELPLLAVLATQIHGVTEVHGAEELRVKESDRIEAVAVNLRAMGAVIETFEDGFKIIGPQKLHGAEIKTFHDHRIAMAFSIAGLVADGETIIHDAECCAVSYPDFFEDLKKLTEG